MMRRLVDSAYAAVLFLYPPGLRRTHGKDMRRCARDLLARRGFDALPRLVLDVSISLAREWAAVARWPGLGGDASYAARLLMRSPGFSAAAIATLGLCIGANTAIFTLVDRTMLHPLFVSDPATLAGIDASFSYPDGRALPQHTKDAFADVALISGSGRLVAEVDGASTAIRPSFVSGNYFSVIGVAAAQGRTLLPSDEIPNAPIVGVASAEWFRTQLGGRSDAIGRTIYISGEPVTIVGVLPAAFRGTSLFSAPTLFVPLSATPRLRTGFFSRPEILQNGHFLFLSAVGRLRPNVTHQQAGAVVSSAMAALHPPRSGEIPASIDVMPLAVRAIGGAGAGAVSRFVWLLAGVVGSTLLVGCANLANLLLARAAVRARELRLRRALGASRGRIVRQMLTESALLAALGAAAGIYLAPLCLEALARFELPGGLDVANLRLSLDARALLFAAALTMVTAALFGLLPALRASGDGMLHLRAGRGVVGPHHRWREALIAFQLALSVVLLAGSSLFIHSLQRAMAVPLGFDVRGVATGSVNLEAVRYTRERALGFYDAVLSRATSIPGVTHAAWSTVMPITGASMWTTSIEGRQQPATVYTSDVSWDYFAAAGTRILEGRGFNAADTSASTPVAVVSQAAAQRFWNGRALGRRIRISDEAWAEVVGVAEDTRTETLVGPAEPYVYLPLPQRAAARLDDVHLFVRVEADAEAALPLLAGAIRAVDRSVPIYSLVTFAQRTQQLVMPMRLGAALFSAFGTLALVLAVVGVYAVSAYVAAQRMAEIGVRMALGATQRDIRHLILARGSVPAVVGITAGLALTVALGRVAAAFLFEANSSDPWALAPVAAVLLGVALAANYVPAARAARLDPTVALRRD